MDVPKEADGPWTRLDHAQLQREAESKEAKLKRRQEQREDRAAARKERRHQKAEAKQARKANVTRATKWNTERKALDKQKKLANRPHKQEKRRKRMLHRAARLEEQAKKMWTESQKLRVRYQFLTDLKEKEEAEKNKIHEEVKQLQAKDTDEYIPLDADDVSSSGSDEEVGGDEMNGTASEQHAAIIKQGSSEDMDMFEDAVEEAEPESQPLKEEELSKPKKIKKSKKVKLENGDTAPTEGEINGGPMEEKAERKKKKKKKKEYHLEGEEADNGGVAEEQAKADRKAEKKRKREEKAAAAAEAGDDEPLAKKSKKKKKTNGAASETYADPTPGQELEADVKERWNVRGLEGGAERQDKFMKLLGGKKARDGGAAGQQTPPDSGTRGRLNMGQVATDLERQWAAGVQMKFGSQGQKRGLGA